MKMRQHSAHRAWVSRKHRHFIELEAEFRLWNSEFDVAIERAGAAISDFIFNVGEAWQKACAEAAIAIHQEYARKALAHLSQERG